MDSFFSFAVLGALLAVAWVLRRRWLPRVVPQWLRVWLWQRSQRQPRFVQPIEPPQEPT